MAQRGFGRSAPAARNRSRAFEHKQEVLGAVFSKDESRVLTWGRDDTARLWAIGTGSKEPLQSFRAQGVGHWRSVQQGRKPGADVG